MKTVRAKFKCNSIETMESWTDKQKYMYTAKFSPVMSDDPMSENKKFWEASPGGSLELNTIKSDHFKVGQEYYLDFTEAPAAE